MSRDFKKTKRIVVKIGSSILLEKGLGFSSLFFSSLAKQVHTLVKQKREVVLVSSGAIAAGMHRLGIKKRPHLIPQKQALAASGQTALMHQYEKVFRRFKMPVGQILLTRDDLSERRRYLNARQAIMELLRLKVIPIINENDTVAVDEIQVGDNDNLSALVTNLVEADLLILLTDIDGVYTADPTLHKKATLLSEIHNIDEAVEKYATGTKETSRVGGMITKLEAAKKSAHFGIPAVIANGKTKNILLDVMAGKEIGTLVLPRQSIDQVNTRKHWIAYTLPAMGSLIVDEGAQKALLQNGKSLLPAGVANFQGQFERGDCVEIKTADNKIFARGLVSYSSLEIQKIKGRKTAEIEALLGYKFLDEVIHRDDLVLL